MAEPISRSTRWGVVLAIGVALGLGYLLRYILLPFVAAGALAYVARPMVHWLKRRLGFSQWLAALLPFLSFLCLLAGVAYLIEKMVVPQLTAMLADGPTLLREFLRNSLRSDRVQMLGRSVTVDQIVNSIMHSPQVQEASNPDQIVGLATAGFTAVMGMVITIVVLAFFLFQGPRLAAGLLWLVPPHLRVRTCSLVRQIDPMLASYLRGVFVIVLYTCLATYVVTGPIFHVTHAIQLALAVGLLELIPVIGPILSFVAFGLIAVEQTGFTTIIGFGIFAIALRLSIDQLVGPLVLGRAARIPAVVVIFAFLAGGVLYGILGVLLAIPFAATIKIVLANLYGEAGEDY
jgi:predicted PurR-regulated permease PerM